MRELIEGAELADIVHGFILPASIVALVLALASSRPRHAGLAGALALALSIWSGYFALPHLGPLKPTSPGRDWLPFLPLFAIPAGWVAGFVRPIHLVWPILMASAFVAALPIVQDWVGMMAFWGVILAYASFFGSAAFVFGRMSATTQTLAMLAISNVAVFLMIESYLARLTQISGLMVAACLPALIIAALWGRDPERPSFRGLAPGFTAFLTGLMFSAYQGKPSTHVPPSCYAMLALSPATLFVSRIPAVARLSPWWSAIVTLAPLALVLAVIVARVLIA